MSRAASSDAFTDMHEAETLEGDARGLMKAAKQGDVEAQHVLGLMFWTGDGAPQCDNRAMMLIKAAAASGHADASILLPKLIDEMSRKSSVADESSCNSSYSSPCSSPSRLPRPRFARADFRWSFSSMRDLIRRSANLVGPPMMKRSHSFA